MEPDGIVTGMIDGKFSSYIVLPNPPQPWNWSNHSEVILTA